MSGSQSTERTYARVRLVVGQIPPGRVATYGQVAAIVGRCTPRMAGYALAALPAGSDVPWQRVINAQGKISPRGDNHGAVLQEELLAQEGILFGPERKISLPRYRWEGPGLAWLLENGFDPESSWTPDEYEE
ncbi:MAG: MGMT family protein [Caldilineaceae bacterium]|nr:MGMT family protein [Caldilineaceae bacterium]